MSKPIFNIGKARDRILLQQQSNVSDGAGGFTTTWVDLLDGDTFDNKIYAIVKPMQGSRGLQYQQTVNFYPYSVIIRFNRSLDYNANYRFILDDKVFVIHSIINVDERRFAYELLAYTRGEVVEVPPPVVDNLIYADGIYADGIYI